MPLQGMEGLAELEALRPIEEQVALFKRFLETSGQALGMAKLDGRIFYANATLCRMLGAAKPDDLYQTDVFAYYEPEKAKRLRDEILPIVQDKGQWVGELNLVDVRGGVTPTIQNIFLLRDEAGQPLCIANVITDISDRLRLEQKLRTYRDRLEEIVAQRTTALEKVNLLLKEEIAEHQQSRDELLRLTSTLENTSDLVATSLADERLLYMNAGGRRMVGWGTDEDACQHRISDVHPEWALRLLRKEAFPTALAQGVWQGETAIVNSRGVEIPVSQVVVAHRSANGDLEYLSTVMRDISERKRAEDTLRESEEKFRTIFENAPMSIAITDVNGRFLDINEYMRKNIGLSREAIIGHYPDEVPQAYRPENSDEILHKRQKFREQGFIQNEEMPLVRPSDNERATALFFARIITIAGSPTVVTMMLDITERKKMEEALRESESQYRGLVENSLVGIFILQDGKVRYVNKCICDMHGYTDPQEFIAKSETMSTVHPDDRDKAIEYEKNLAQNLGVLVFNVRSFTKDGRTLFQKVFARTIIYEGKPALLGTAIDLTRERNLEAQLLQAQKMEAIGTLAGGVAHDFNNLLTAISGNTELALMKPNLDPEVKAHLQEIQNASTSAAELTKQLLAFSRKQIIEPKVIDLNELIWNMGKMLARIIGEDISLHSVAQPGIYSIKADPGQIQQIIINLAVNARDAMPDGGVLTIETANTYVDAEFCRRYADVSPGDYVVLSVSDTGSGMSAEVKERLFEPFFTTKAFGKGTGLGLATVYGAVKQNRGAINVYSEPDHGTCFKIYLPKTEGEKSAVSGDFTHNRLPRGSETILLVEDDVGVREFTRRVLEHLGYHVLAAHNGEEALSLARGYSDQIRLLLTDVVLPGMNGRQVAEALARERPGLEVLFVSGYTHDTIVNQGVLEQDLHFISKPFSAKDLAYKLRERLE